MANMLIKVGDSPDPKGYKDGDVLMAWNRRRIRQVHAEHICCEHEDRIVNNQRESVLVGTNGDGLLRDDHMAKILLRHTRPLIFVRLSFYEAKLVRQSDGEEIRFRTGETFADFDGRTGRMDIEDFCKGKRDSPMFPIFGAKERESLYFGVAMNDHPHLDNVWTDIDNHPCDITEAHSHCAQWCYGIREPYEFICLDCEDMDNRDVASLMEPQYDLDDDGYIKTDADGNAIELSRRNININWRDDLVPDLPVTVEDITNQRTRVGKEIHFLGRHLQTRPVDQPQQKTEQKFRDKTTKKVRKKRRRGGGPKRRRV